jgi:hypothetical protein
MIMHNRLTTVAMAASIAVAVTGSGIAIASSSAKPPVHACASKKGNNLALLKNGKCAHGFSKVTLGARGARGKRGPQGPGAISDTLTNPNDDVQRVFPHTVGGVTIATSCGMAANVSIALEPSTGTGTVSGSGTATVDNTITPADTDNANSLSTTGTTRADLDVVISANGGSFVRIDVHGEHDAGKCTFWEVAIPTSTATG